MPRERTVRQPAGPGRTRRTRTPRSAASASEGGPAATASGSGMRAAGRALARRLPRPRLRDVGFTRRALVLLGVFAILALPYANSLRILVNQQRDLALANAQIAERTAQVSELDAQLQRWRDPAFVMSQARTQLGWVLPGETGYRVIGTDGKVVLEAGESSGLAEAGVADETRWWDRLADSVRAADGAPAKS
nr:septum formation initiator family protein [Propionibacterium sp.]